MTQTMQNLPRWVEGRDESSQSLPEFSLVSSEGIILVSALVGVAISSIRYAVWLNTPTGRKWDEQHTWFVTVIGVLITLAWLAVHDPKAALKAVGFFVVSGMPIVVRALDLESKTLEQFINRETK